MNEHDPEHASPASPSPPPIREASPTAERGARAGFDPTPLWARGWHGRCRPRHLATWGIVTITLAVFVSLMTYIPIVERGFGTPADAAKAVIPGLVVVQAILLMMFGTGAVAAGVSRERDAGLLDYQRMTPMAPTANILGHLVGLPLREYVLVLMLMPLVIVAAWLGEFSFLTLAHFYAVFASSVLVYHMTALVAGMVSSKPRLAQMTSIGLVAVLYFVLPNLSRIGITFFEFLTIRPTFFGLLQQEMPEAMRPQLEASGIDSFRDVPFFDGAMHPTLYTMLVQGFVLVVMFVVVHRKWRRESSHVLSKAGATVVHGGITGFILASVWAIVRQDDAYMQVFGRLMELAGRSGRSPESLELLLIVAAAILAGAYLILVTMITPERHVTLEGWRRARKRGAARLSRNADAASSLPASLAMLATTILAGVIVMVLAIRGGEYVASGPEASSVLILLAGMVGAALFLQGVRSRLGLRLFSVGLFLLWMVPFFAMLVMIAATADPLRASYLGLPSPPVTLGWSIARMMATAESLPGVDARLLPPEIAVDGLRLTAVGAGGHLLLGILAQVWAVRHRVRLHRLGIAGEDAGDGSGDQRVQELPAV